jgi:hypothetical protein
MVAAAHAGRAAVPARATQAARACARAAVRIAAARAWPSRVAPELCFHGGGVQQLTVGGRREFAAACRIGLAGDQGLVERGAAPFELREQGTLLVRVPALEEPRHHDRRCELRLQDGLRLGDEGEELAGRVGHARLADDRAPAGMQHRGLAGDRGAHGRGGEDVGLRLDGRRPGSLGKPHHGGAGAEGVREGHDGAAVHDARHRAQIGTYGDLGAQALGRGLEEADPEQAREHARGVLLKGGDPVHDGLL